MKYYFSFLILFFLVQPLMASHIIGGDIYYDYLGNNQYRFYITLYRDCASTGAAYDDPLQLAIHNGNGVLVQNVSIPFPGSTPVPLNFNNPCATPPGGICVEKATYITVVTLPPSPLGYDISYQRCCRGPNVTNLITPDDTGITLTTHIPGTNLGNGNMYQNSSPRFINYPPILLCNTEAKIFNHGATDPDGDVLTYSLVTPNAGASSVTPLPPQTPAPPYPPVQWAPGFNANAPLGPGSTLTINQNTGIMQVVPQNVGLFVVGVKVTETRNGVVIGSTIRDFLFRIFNCNITLQALLPTQEQLPTFISYCQGLTVNFVNNSYGGSSYAWDFGVSGTNSDVSTAFQPAFTYPSPGTYTASLIVNPGQPCTDTAYMTLVVNNPFSISWTSNDSVCIVGNQFNFIGNSSAPAGTGTYNWTFPGSASISTANTLNVPNVSFNSPGFHPVTLTGDNGDCVTSFTDSIYIFDIPVANPSVPANLNCLGLTVPFGNNSTNALYTSWDFGVQGTLGDTSNQVAPTFTYPSPGTYSVVLTVSSGPNCSDSDSINITINEPLVLSFTHNDSLCINGGLYNFDGTVSGPPNASFWWDFGANGMPNTSTSVDVSGVSFLFPGIQNITLYGAFDNCIDSVQSQAYVYFEPQIGFTMIPELPCAPFSATFINTSTTDGPATYLWDFGDGTFSNGLNGFHTYYQVGSYSVGLTLITLEGCIDTLNLFIQDLVQVNPSPVAGFSFSPTEVNVCENKVTFVNESSGATSYIYVIDQNSFITEEPNFTHEYNNIGTDYPFLTVTNEFGCKDSVRKTILVFPFTMYIPNTFVPDKDGINDVFLAISPYEIYDWEMLIYNRWGQCVFNGDDIAKGWDGTFLGLESPDGVYTYKIRYRGCEFPSAWQQIEGSVRLVR